MIKSLINLHDEMISQLQITGRRLKNGKRRISRGYSDNLGGFAVYLIIVEVCNGELG